MLKISSSLLLVVFFILATACSSNKTVSPPTVVQQQDPISVEVTNSVLDENNHLNLRVLLSSKTDIFTEQVLISAVGLSDGQVVVEQTKPLSEVYNLPVVGPGKKIAVSFKLKAELLNEYQVHVNCFIK